MKIQKIISICKKKKALILFDDKQRNIQWISDGHCIFPLNDMAEFNMQTLCKAYDITETQQSKMLLRDHEQLPEIFDYSDSNNFETEVFKHSIMLLKDGTSVIALITDEGAVFINSIYLTPLSDYVGDDLKFFQRTAANGTTYFAVKNGLLLVGIITPVEVINKNFIEELNYLKNTCDATWFNMQNGNKSKNEQVEFEADDEDV